MLAADVATNVLASALWEIAIRPLYRSAFSRVFPSSDRRALEAALDEAAEQLARSEQSDSVPAAAWSEFFEANEMRTLAQDLVAFRLDQAGADLTDLKAAFSTSWRLVAYRKGIPEDRVDVDEVFGALVKAVDTVLQVAIGRGVLSAHEAKAAARHRVVEARLDVIESLL